jgi:DNA-directed RNA polymerase subunit RPC12/RpoP
MWICPNCSHKIHQEIFFINRIEKDIEDAIEKFESSTNRIICSNCSYAIIPQKLANY